MSRSLHRGFARAHVFLLALCAAGLLLAAPASSAGSDAGNGKSAGGSPVTSSGCLIEPWYCGEEPTCFIEPWECEGGGPECWIEPWECEGGGRECFIEPWECEREGDLRICSGGFCKYIVVFWGWVEDPAALAYEQVDKYGGRLGFIYRHALKGYSVEYRTSVVNAVACEPTVKYVEKDQIVELFGTSSSEQVGSVIEGDDCETKSPAPKSPQPEPVVPGPGPSGEGAARSTTGPSAPGGAGEGSGVLPRSQRSSLGGCGRAKVRRQGRCVRRRSLARRICRKRKGAARRKCVRRTMRRLSRIAMLQAPATPARQ